MKTAVTPNAIRRKVSMKSVVLEDNEWVTILEALGYVCDEFSEPKGYVELQEKLKAILASQENGG